MQGEEEREEARDRNAEGEEVQGEEGKANKMDVNGIFNPQNRFWSFMEKVMNLCAISFLWLLFSLPIVTAGASTVALFQYTLKLTRDEEGYIWRTFIRGFRRNFFQATALWIGMVAVGAFLVFDLYCCQFMPVPAAAKWAVRVLLVSLIFVYLLTVLYILPLVAFFHTTLKKAVVHSFIMAMGNLYVSVTILVVYGIAGVVTYFIPMLFMVWFALASYVASHLYGSVFRRYVDSDEEKVDEEEDYCEKIDDNVKNKT